MRDVGRWAAFFFRRRFLEPSSIRDVSVSCSAVGASYSLRLLPSTPVDPGQAPFRPFRAAEVQALCRTMKDTKMAAARCCVDVGKMRYYNAQRDCPVFSLSFGDEGSRSDWIR
jgi:hypothetical protein